MDVIYFYNRPTEHYIQLFSVTVTVLYAVPVLFWGLWSTVSLMVHSLWFHLRFSWADRNFLLHPDVQFSDPAAPLAAEHGVCVVSSCQEQGDGGTLCVVRCVVHLDSGFRALGSAGRRTVCLWWSSLEAGDSSGLRLASGSHSAPLLQFFCVRNFFRIALTWTMTCIYLIIEYICMHAVAVPIPQAHRNNIGLHSFDSLAGCVKSFRDKKLQNLLFA